MATADVRAMSPATRRPERRRGVRRAGAVGDASPSRPPGSEGPERAGLCVRATFVAMLAPPAAAQVALGGVMRFATADAGSSRVLRRADLLRQLKRLRGRAAEPRRERAFPAEPGQPPPGADERLLRHILGRARIADQRRREADQPPLVAYDERFERAGVPGARIVDDRAVGIDRHARSIVGRAADRDGRVDRPGRCALPFHPAVSAATRAGHSQGPAYARALSLCPRLGAPGRYSRVRSVAPRGRNRVGRLSVAATTQSVTATTQ